MSFPYNDRLWVDTADFVVAARAANETILAPDLFMWRFDRIHTYDATYRNPDLEVDWAVLHKDQLGEISLWALAHIDASMRPLHANEVFVVFGRNDELEAVDETEPHLRSYVARLAERRDATDGGPALEAARVAPAPRSGVTAEPGALFKFDTLAAPELRDAMNSFHSQGGYEFPTLRDKELRSEVLRKVQMGLPDCAGKRVLDLGAGSCGAVGLVADAELFVGVDVSDVALQLLLEAEGRRPDVSVAVMDAEGLALPDETFDIVTCVEMIEHVFDADSLLSEATRVLRGGGTLVLSTTNSESLHLRLHRKLGYPEFPTSNQHIRELSLSELSDAISATGLQVEAAQGVFLYPYFGLPGIDEIVRPLEDEDTEIVEALRSLGDSADPQYAYEVIITARKPIDA